MYFVTALNSAASGHRLAKLLAYLEYPYGLSVGIDSAATKIDESRSSALIDYHSSHFQAFLGDVGC